MSMIYCPECKREISDMADFCPGCGFPIGRYRNPNEVNDRQVQPAEADHSDKTYPYPHTEDLKTYRAKNTDETYLYPHTVDLTTYSNINNAPFQQTNDVPKKKGKTKFVILGISVAVIIFAAAIVLFFILSDSTLSVKNISIGKILETDGYYSSAQVVSNEKKPFVAVFEDILSSNINTKHSYVYMENGKGTIDYLCEDRNLISVGYFEGGAVSEKDMESISTVYEFTDYDSLNETACTVEFDITMYQNDSGLLFYELTNDINSKKTFGYITVCNGRGEGSDYLSDLPYRTEKMNVKLEPKFFVAAQNLDADNYTVVTPLSVQQKDSTSTKSVYYEGSETIHSDSYKNGMIFYQYGISTGGSEEKRSKIQCRYAYLENGECTLTVYDQFDNQNFEGAPSYYININAYLKWNQL